MSVNTVNYEILTPLNFLDRAANYFEDKTAVVYGDTKFTYSQFFDRIQQFANGLKAKGIGKGDKVAFLCPNTPPLLEAHYAVPMVGASLVPINVRLSSREVSYILSHCEAKMVFVDNQFSELVTTIQDELKIDPIFVSICDVSNEQPLPGPEYESFLASSSKEPVQCAVEDERDVITINYTSGTTGRPKGVMYHHRGAYLNALGENIEFGLDFNSVYLWTLPMFHCNGWCFTWAVTATGGTHVCLRKVEPQTIFDLIDKENITHLCAAPTVLIALASHATEKGIKLDKKLEIMTAGAPPAPKIIEEMEETGANITQTYGLTEVYGPHTICTWNPEWNDLSVEERAKIKARQGIPYVHAHHLDVVEPNTMASIPRDGETIGEIVMRGNNVMLGYYKDSEATEKAFEGGWYHSGDLAIKHPNGYVQIMDRKKDIIVSGGENIATVEVENTIFMHPDVQEVAVVSTPDPKWGEVPKAFVTLKPDTNTSKEDIIDFCKQHLARFKAPKQVEFCDLPKTATGKIQKFKLREKEWQGKEKTVA